MRVASDDVNDSVVGRNRIRVHVVMLNLYLGHDIWLYMYLSTPSFSKQNHHINIFKNKHKFHIWCSALFIVDPFYLYLIEKIEIVLSGT